MPESLAGIAVAESRRAIAAREVTQASSGSSPKKAGQLPFGFCTRTRKSSASRTSSECSDPTARVARHVVSRDACTDGRSAAHPPEGAAFDSTRPIRCSTTPSLFTIALLMRNRSTVKSDIAEEGDVGRKAGNSRCTDASKSGISQSVISKLLSADLA
jgi:hypothetical protein